MIELPIYTPDESDWDMRLTLGNQELLVRLRWNPRPGFWFMDVDDQRGHAIYSRKLTPIFPILRSHKALMPIVGDFVMYATSEASPEYPTFEGLGVTHRLVWMDDQEIRQWEASLGI